MKTSTRKRDLERRLRELITGVSNAKLNMKAGRLREASADLSACLKLVPEKSIAALKLRESIRTIQKMEEVRRDGPDYSMLIAHLNRQLDQALWWASKLMDELEHEGGEAFKPPHTVTMMFIH
jgi:hypothetical protein